MQLSVGKKNLASNIFSERRVQPLRQSSGSSHIKSKHPCATYTSLSLVLVLKSCHHWRMLHISPGNPINPLPQVTQVFHRILASLAWDLWIVKLNIDKHQAGGDPDCHILMGRVGYLHHGTPWLKPDPGVENTALFVFNASLPPAAVNAQFKRVQIVLFVNVHYICIYIIYIIPCVYVYYI